MIEIPGMEIEIVRVHGKGGILELNYDFDAFAFGARGKVQERMLVEAKLSEDSIQASRSCFGHKGIVKQALQGSVNSLRVTGMEDEDYSYRNASMGFSLAALIAGNMPLTMPTKLRIAVDQISVAESI